LKIGLGYDVETYWTDSKRRWTVVRLVFKRVIKKHCQLPILYTRSVDDRRMNEYGAFVE
jgi:hypothetical protein